MNRPYSQSTSYSRFTIAYPVRCVFRIVLSSRQPVAAADVAHVLLFGETPAEPGAQSGGIQPFGDLCVAAARRHFMDVGDSLLRRFQ
jgi:hypothetical protein